MDIGEKVTPVGFGDQTFYTATNNTNKKYDTKRVQINAGNG
jgi:hypothetical protein